MTQLKDGGRQPGNREEQSLSASTVIARWQGNGWDEPCKSRGLRTVLWAAGGEIPPADPAMRWSAPPVQRDLHTPIYICDYLILDTIAPSLCLDCFPSRYREDRTCAVQFWDWRFSVPRR